MFPGQQRRRVEIQQALETRNELGEPELTWSKVTEAHAAIVRLRGREYFAGQQSKAEADVRITIGYQPNIAAKMRVTDGDRLFDIESVIDIDDRNRTLELMCKEAV